MNNIVEIDLIGENMEKTMWFVTVVEKIEENKFGFVVFGDDRTWGFFSNKDDAVRVLHNNITDVHESFYEYAVIEEYYEGIGSSTQNRQWFKWNDKKGGYVEINEPICVRNICNFAIG